MGRIYAPRLPEAYKPPVYIVEYETGYYAGYVDGELVYMAPEAITFTWDNGIIVNCRGKLCWHGIYHGLGAGCIREHGRTVEVDIAFLWKGPRRWAAYAGRLRSNIYSEFKERLKDTLSGCRCTGEDKRHIGRSITVEPVGGDHVGELVFTAYCPQTSCDAKIAVFLAGPWTDVLEELIRLHDEIATALGLQTSEDKPGKPKRSLSAVLEVNGSLLVAARIGDNLYLVQGISNMFEVGLGTVYRTRTARYFVYSTDFRNTYKCIETCLGISIPYIIGVDLRESIKSKLIHTPYGVVLNPWRHKPGKPLILAGRGYAYTVEQTTDALYVPALQEDVTPFRALDLLLECDYEDSKCKVFMDIFPPEYVGARVYTYYDIACYLASKIARHIVCRFSGCGRAVDVKVEGRDEHRTALLHLANGATIHYTLEAETAGRTVLATHTIKAGPAKIQIRHPVISLKHTMNLMKSILGGIEYKHIDRTIGLLGLAIASIISGTT